MKKRTFDVLLAAVTSPAWVTALAVSSLAIWLLEGRPIFYVSVRRVFRKQTLRIVKFRTMVRNADKIANRATVPIRGVRFLNIPPESPLYTPIGRALERVHFTELPQMLHVLAGTMSVIGNRPLPESVVTALRQAYPAAEERFLTKCGLTGPVQLIGRDALSDGDRLTLETVYCRASLHSYSPLLDVLVLGYTVLIALRIVRPFSLAEVHDLIARHTGVRLVPQAAPASRGITVEEDVRAVSR